MEVHVLVNFRALKFVFVTSEVDLKDVQIFSCQEWIRVVEGSLKQVAWSILKKIFFKNQMLQGNLLTLATQSSKSLAKGLHLSKNKVEHLYNFECWWNFKRTHVADHCFTVTNSSESVMHPQQRNACKRDYSKLHQLRANKLEISTIFLTFLKDPFFVWILVN